MNFTPATITEIESENSSDVYVLNRGIIKYKKKCNIIFSHFSQGQARAYSIPPTYVPWNIGEAIPKDDLIRNSDFRSLIAQGTLQLVKSAEARKFIDNNPDARKEVQRIKDESVVTFTPGEDNNRLSASNPEGLKIPTEEPEGTGIEPVVYDIFSRDDLDDSARLNSLRTISDTLTTKDWVFIASKTTNPDILNMANKHTSK